MALTRSEISALLEQAVLTDIIQNQLYSTPLNEEEWLDKQWLFKAAGKGSLNLVNFLLQQGFNPNTTDAEGHTPICRAASEGHLPVVQALLVAGANANASEQADFPPLFRAAEAGNIEIIKLLIKHGADVNQEVKRYRNAKGQTAVHASVSQGDITMVKYLVEEANAEHDHIDSNGFTPLHLSCMHAQDEICAYLLQKGAGVNHPTHDGRTPLYLCIESYAGDSSANIAAMLIRHGARTSGLIHFAASFRDNHQPLLDLLLQAGENVNSLDAEKNTPLHRAVQYGCLANATYLLQQGANLHARNKHNISPLRLCIESNLDILVKLEMLARFREVTTEIHELLENNETLLHKAAENPQHLILELLLQGRPHLSDTNDFGEIAIHSAAKRGQYNNVMKLLDAGSPIDFRLKRIRTLSPTTSIREAQCCLGLIAEKELRPQEALVYYQKATQQDNYAEANFRAALLLLTTPYDQLDITPAQRDQCLKEYFENVISAYIAQRDFNNLVLAAYRLEQALVQSTFSSASFNPVFVSILSHTLTAPHLPLLPGERFTFANLLFLHEEELRENEKDTKILERALKELTQALDESQEFPCYFKKEREHIITLKQFVEAALQHRDAARFEKLEGYKTSSIFATSTPSKSSEKSPARAASPGKR